MTTFTEQRILKQVTTLPAESAINVQWANQVLKDGTVISETFDGRTYYAEQKDAFLAEVEGAASYIDALGW